MQIKKRRADFLFMKISQDQASRLLLCMALMTACSEKKRQLDYTADTRDAIERKSIDLRKEFSGSSTGQSKRANTSSLAVRFEKGEKLEALWDEAVGIDLSVAERIQLLSSLIEVSSASQSHQLEALITSSFPEGNVRDSLISTLYSNSRDSFGQTLDRVLKIKNPSDKESAMSGVVKMLKEGRTSIEACEGLDRLDDASLATMVSQGLFGGIYESSKAGTLGIGQIDDAFAMVRIIASHSSDKTEIYGDFLKKLATLDPEKAFLLTSTLGAEVSKETATSMMQFSLSRLASSNPAEAAKFARESNLDLQGVLTEWMRQDSNMAQKWFEDNKVTLSASQTAQYYSSLVSHLVNLNNCEDGWKYVEAIKDPELKRIAENKVWTTERSNLRKEVGKDPDGTMQAIVSGKSKYGEYWLEEAMGTWISKDFDKAQSWYQDNWNKLPANKSQFLAAAFANQATGQGDTATARQWAAYIQDPKTKQRIEAGIAKAESAKHN